MATKKSKCSQTGDLNLQEGAIFSRSLNDNRRMIMTGLYMNRNLEKTNRNRTVSSEPRVTDISVNRGSPICLNNEKILTEDTKRKPVLSLPCTVAPIIYNA